MRHKQICTIHRTISPHTHVELRYSWLAEHGCLCRLHYVIILHCIGYGAVVNYHKCLRGHPFLSTTIRGSFLCRPCCDILFTFPRFYVPTLLLILYTHFSCFWNPQLVRQINSISQNPAELRDYCTKPPLGQKFMRKQNKDVLPNKFSRLLVEKYGFVDLLLCFHYSFLGPFELHVHTPTEAPLPLLIW